MEPLPTLPSPFDYMNEPPPLTSTPTSTIDNGTSRERPSVESDSPMTPIVAGPADVGLLKRRRHSDTVEDAPIGNKISKTAHTVVDADIEKLRARARELEEVESKALALQDELDSVQDELEKTQKELTTAKETNLSLANVQSHLRLEILNKRAQRQAVPDGKEEEIANRVETERRKIWARFQEQVKEQSDQALASLKSEIDEKFEIEVNRRLATVANGSTDELHEQAHKDVEDIVKERVAAEKKQLDLLFEESVQKRVAFELEAKITSKMDELRMEASDDAEAKVKMQVEAEKKRLDLQFEASVQTRVISDLETRIQSKVEELRMEARNGVDVEVKRQADAEKERLALQFEESVRTRVKSELEAQIKNQTEELRKEKKQVEAEKERLALQFDASVQTRVASDLETRIQSKMEEIRKEASDNADAEMETRVEAEKERLALQFEESVRKRVESELEAKIKNQTEELWKEANDDAEAEVKKQADTEKERLALQFEESVRKRVESELEAKIKIKIEELRKEASNEVEEEVQTRVEAEKKRMALQFDASVQKRVESELEAQIKNKTEELRKEASNTVEVEVQTRVEAEKERLVLQLEASVRTRVASDLETRIQSKMEELRKEARNKVEVGMKKQADAEKERLALQLEDSIQKRVAFELEAEIKEKTEELRKEARDNADAEVKKQAEAEKERLALQFEESVRKRVESELEAKIKIKTEELRKEASNDAEAEKERLALQFEESVRKRVESELEAKIKIKTEELREASSNVDAKVQAEVATEKRRLELLFDEAVQTKVTSNVALQIEAEKARLRAEVKLNTVSNDTDTSMTDSASPHETELASLKATILNLEARLKSGSRAMTPTWYQYMPPANSPTQGPHASGSTPVPSTPPQSQSPLRFGGGARFLSSNKKSDSAYKEFLYQQQVVDEEDARLSSKQQGKRRAPSYSVDEEDDNQDLPRASKRHKSFAPESDEEDDIGDEQDCDADNTGPKKTFSGRTRRVAKVKTPRQVTKHVVRDARWALLREIFRKAFGYKVEPEIVLHMPATLEEIVAYESAPDGASKPCLPVLHLDVTRGSREWKTPYNMAVMDALVLAATQSAEKKPEVYELKNPTDADKWEVMISDKMYRLLRRFEKLTGQLEQVMRSLPPDCIEEDARVALGDRLLAIASEERKTCRVISQRNLKFYDRTDVACMLAEVAKQAGLSAAHEIFQYIIRLLLRSSPAAMSSEDSDMEDGRPVLRCARMPWRRTIDNVLDLIDNATKRNPGLFHRNAYQRIPRIRRADNRETRRDPPRDFARELFDPSWISAQSPGAILALRLKSTVFHFNEVYEKEALMMGQIAISSKL